MKAHILKTLKGPFDDHRVSGKGSEVRQNDRDFQKGDIVILREWSGMFQKYTGRKSLFEISHIEDRHGMQKGWVVLSWKRMVYMDGPVENETETTDSGGATT